MTGIDSLRPVSADLVVDTSAIVAILLEEPDAARCANALQRALGPLTSTTCVLELLLVMERRHGADGAAEAKDFLHDTRIATVPVDHRTALDAHDAWQRFGKGRHPAKLNFGDCFAYALARHWDLPLLCVGDDFAQTDVTLALA